MPTLELLTPASAPAESEFEGNVLLGRGVEADIFVDDETVSRRHAMLNRVDGSYFVSDLGSGNGTWLNERRVSKPLRLRNGDRLRLGTVLLRFKGAANSSGREPVEATPIPLESELPADHQVLHSLDAPGSLTPLVPDASAESESLRQRLQLILDIVTATGSILDEDALLSLFLDKLFEALPQADRGFILILDTDTDELQPRVSHDRAGLPTAPAVSRTLLTDAVRNRRGVLTIDAMHDERFAGAATIQGMQLRSVLCAPMISADEVFGVIQLDTSAAGVAFGPEDMALLLGIAGHAALCLRNARMHRELADQQLIHHDMALAGRIQGCFLPRGLPTIPGYDLALEYRPALQVGGDYYDFLELDGDRIGVVVGDVSGKGVSAALCMARLSSVARFLVTGEVLPQQILSRLNRCLFEEFAQEGMFATLGLVALDSRSGDLTLANAGHLAPLVRRADGRVQALPVALDPGLGIDPEARFSTQEAHLEPRDTILLYSDGVIEATAPDTEQFGIDRLVQVLGRADGGPEEVVRAVTLAVEQFSQGGPQADDLTVVVCRRQP